MTSISYVNELYGGEDAKRRARVNARFINDAMMATVLGDVVSDGLEDGRIVSGVGGQYNFVAQGFALEGARSVIMLRASRTAKGKTQSNIRWRYGHTTIPRHLRDMIVTEYGVADLRGKSDRDVIAAMLAITDQRFQDDLLRQAKDAGKIERSFELPDAARDNTPDAIEQALKPAAGCGAAAAVSVRQRFHRDRAGAAPCAANFEIGLDRKELAGLLLRGLSYRAEHQELLDRLGLAQPRSPSEWLYAALVRGALDDAD